MKVTLLLLFSLNLMAEVSLPSKYFDLDQIVAPFKQPLKDKLSQLEQNYIQREKKQLRAFIASETTICSNGEKLNRNQLVAAVKYNKSEKKVNDKEILRESIQYRGCGDKLNFLEEIHSEAKSVTPLKWEAVRLSNVRFKINKSEDLRIYRLLTSEREEILKISQIKVSSQKYKTTYFSLSQPVVTIVDDYSNGHDKEVVVHPLRFNNVNIRFNGSNFTFNSDGNGVTKRARAQLNKTGEITLINNQGQLMSYNAFLEFINTAKKNISDKVVLFYKHGWSRSYPQTSFSGGGNLNAKFLTDLRVNQSRLLTNSQMNLVILFIQELIKAATANEIQDKRSAD